MLSEIDTIGVLNEQISVLLDLIICADSDCVDVRSIQIAAEMISTMQTDLMKEINKIEEKWRNANKNDKQS